MWFSRMSKGFDASVQAGKTLDERFGTPAEFTPPGDGVVAPARIEIFLAVRDAMAPSRNAIANIFSQFPNREEAEAFEKKPFTEKLLTGFSLARSSMGLPTTLAEFFKLRDESLVANGMGMGEYSYIYILAYQSWLKHPPRDGPIEGDESTATTPAVPIRVHDNLVTILENQAAALPSDTPQAWRDQLAAEIAAMKGDSTRIPWQDGLPEPIAAGFEPYRARFEATYTPSTNLFELARNRKHGSFSYEAE